jgi:hypothetical protein
VVLTWRLRAVNALFHVSRCNSAMRDSRIHEFGIWTPRCARVSDSMEEVIKKKTTAAATDRWRSKVLADRH